MNDYIEEQARQIDSLHGAEEKAEMARSYAGDEEVASLAEVVISLLSEVRRLRALVEPDAEAERQHLLEMLDADHRSAEPDNVPEQDNDDVPF